MNRPYSWFGRLALVGVGMLGLAASVSGAEPYPFDQAFTRGRSKGPSGRRSGPTGGMSFTEL